MTVRNVDHDDVHARAHQFRSAFEEVAYDPARFDGDALKPYNAGANALLLNYDAFRFRFFPNEAAAGVTVVMDPPVAGYPVVAPKLAGDDCGDWQRKLAEGFMVVSTA